MLQRLDGVCERQSSLAVVYSVETCTHKRDHTRALTRCPLSCCCLQVYDITMELVHMYDHYRKPISPEQCRSLLAVVRAPVPPPTAHDAAAAAALAAAAANAGAGQPPPSVAAPGGVSMPTALK